MQGKITVAKDKNIQNEIKICHVTIMLNTPGGAERMLMQLILSNPESAHKKMVVTLCQAGAWGEQLKSVGVTVHELNMDSFLDAPKAFWQLKQLIKQFKPDIVQTWMYHSDFLGGLAAYFAGYKNIIWGIHRTCLFWSDSKPTLLIMKLCALMSRLGVPKKIISVSQAGKKAHTASGYDSSKIEVIPNGFDFSKLKATAKQRSAFRKACHVADDELVIGCLGRFHQVKGQDNFVKAAALVIKSNPKVKVKFLMIGKDCNENNAELVGWIEQYQVKEHVVLLGNRDDVAVCLSGMDIFCMPSRTEGFPLCLGEAMAMSLPCVATDVGDAAFLAGGTAILVPPQNEQALADGLLKVIALSEEERVEMGKRGKSHVVTEFAIENVGERYNAVYREVMAGSAHSCAD